MSGTDTLALHADGDLRDRKHMIPWTPEEWPPPERIATVGSRAVEGRILSLLTAPDGEAVLESTCQQKYRKSAHEIYEIAYYARKKASKLAPPGPDDNYLRAAAYGPCAGWEGQVEPGADDEG